MCYCYYCLKKKESKRKKKEERKERRKEKIKGKEKRKEKKEEEKEKQKKYQKEKICCFIIYKIDFRSKKKDEKRKTLKDQSQTSPFSREKHRHNSLTTSSELTFLFDNTQLTCQNTK